MILIALTAASAHMELPKGMIESICYVESKYKATALHKDDGGEDSVGLCQLHLSTAKLMGYKGTQKGLLDPKVNAFFAAKYLKHQLARYKGNQIKAIAAYNAGSYRLNAKGEIKNKQYVYKVLYTWKAEELE